MCGRFTLRKIPDEVAGRFEIDQLLFDFEPRFNIAPGQSSAAILVEGGQRVLAGLKWGLVPSWAKDRRIGNRMINARGETLSQRPAFRNALARRRCIVPADGFFEWRKGPGGKIPMLFQMQGEALFGLAGLWEHWVDPDGGGELKTFTIVTTSANRLVGAVHDRMPVILDSRGEQAWLDPAAGQPVDLHSLLGSRDITGLECFPVTTAVNDPSRDHPGCVEPRQALSEEGPGELFPG